MLPTTKRTIENSRVPSFIEANPNTICCQWFTDCSLLPVFFLLHARIVSIVCWSQFMQMPPKRSRDDKHRTSFFAVLCGGYRRDASNIKCTKTEEKTRAKAKKSNLTWFFLDILQTLTGTNAHTISSSWTKHSYTKNRKERLKRNRQHFGELVCGIGRLPC